MKNVSGQEIGDIRRRHRYTQPQFSRIMGVHVQTLSKWERDTARIPRSAQILAYIIDKSPIVRDEVEKIAGLQ